MTSIEKTTVPITKVAIIIGFVITSTVTYFTTKSATEAGVQKAFYEINVRLNNLDNDNKIIWLNLDRAEERIYKMESAIITYMGKAIIPKEPTQERRKRQ